jgi:hypothetical protein
MSELVCKTLELLAETKGSFVSAVKNIFNTRTMATLKIRDLSVGDWVRVEWPDGERWHGRLTLLSVTGGVEVCCANDKHIRCSSDFITSIPITAEMLEKNGFERLLERDLFYHSESGFEVAFEDGEWMHTINLHEYTIHTISGVHHIQHLLRLYGCEKEINL